MKHKTGSSSAYGPPSSRAFGGPSEGGEHAKAPGLLLLYAPERASLWPAYPFLSDELLVGRESDVHIQVPDHAVSRAHARFRREGDAWTLEDLGSRNGTIVDGLYIKKVELDHGAEVRIGDAIFKFVEKDAGKHMRYTIDGNGAGRLSKNVPELVGGAQIDSVALEIERMAPTGLSCVILGETGTGKEVVARALHRLSNRKGQFCAVNCAAIPQNLIESELFGYRRGAFSGADRDKPGIVKLADGGTLFLDEIGDMPLEAQAKLLRVLQSREVFPVGGTVAESVDIRVVCATHRDLARWEREGKFRGDLLARLNEHTTRLPPLRDRKEDIFQLVNDFARRFGSPGASISYSFWLAIFHYDWPYNVRELENAVKRAAALAPDGRFDAAQLPEALREKMKSYGQHASETDDVMQTRNDRGSVPAPAPGSGRRGAPTEEELRDMLARHHGNIAAVGRELGKERMQVHRWLKKYGIDLDQYRT
jgi:transcriptional regulator with GAF, ATPase, and Fis domain